MKERPILFNAPMVRAILAGTKTQTRRLLKPAPQMVTDQVIKPWDGDAAALLGLLTKTGKACPYGQPGDRLWVRETFQQFSDDGSILYKADPQGFREMNELKRDECLEARWRPSIHMPRHASRITMEITSVRVERLQEISEADAAAEGMQYSTDHIGPWSGTGERWWDSARLAFKDLWLSINGPESWDANPWVWVVEFKLMEQPA